jgi:RimJ/RimL family protein N-acetyltransferase
MDPIEINAGTTYLRQLRADDLLDDRDTLRASGIDDPDAHIAARADGWRTDTAYCWAIADPPTGALLGEVGLVDIHDGSASAICWLVAGQQEKGIEHTVLDTVRRFGSDALDLHDIGST